MSVKYWLDCNPQSGKVLMRHRSDGLNHRFRGAGPAGPPHSRRDQPRRISSLRLGGPQNPGPHVAQSEEHTSELQSQSHTSYAVFCLKKKNNRQKTNKRKSKNSTNHKNKET